MLLPPPPPSVPEICEPSALLIDVKFAHSRAPPEPASLAVANPSSVVPCVPTPSKLPAARVRWPPVCLIQKCPSLVPTPVVVLTRACVRTKRSPVRRGSPVVVPLKVSRASR